jgi:hypothetical protein
VFDVFVADKILLDLFPISNHNLIALLEAVIVIGYSSAIFPLHIDIVIA